MAGLQWTAAGQAADLTVARRLPPGGFVFGVLVVLGHGGRGLITLSYRLCLSLCLSGMSQSLWLPAPARLAACLGPLNGTRRWPAPGTLCWWGWLQPGHCRLTEPSSCPRWGPQTLGPLLWSWVPAHECCKPPLTPGPGTRSRATHPLSSGPGLSFGVRLCVGSQQSWEGRGGSVQMTLSPSFPPPSVHRRH